MRSGSRQPAGGPAAGALEAGRSVRDRALYEELHRTFDECRATMAAFAQAKLRMRKAIEAARASVEECELRRQDAV